MALTADLLLRPATSADEAREQFDALVLGLPWQRVGERAVISVL
jgi:hypothetical protein